MKRNKRWALLSVLMALLFCGRVLAQSAIFNIPSTDTVTKGKYYVEFDFQPQIPEEHVFGTFASRTNIYNPRLAAGVIRNYEFGVNFPFYSNSFSNRAFIQPNVKWKFYDDSQSGVALAVGGVGSLPLNHQHGESWGYFYGLASKKFKKGNYGPRFHGGIAIITPGIHASALLGYEQPISKRINIVADWFSGHRFLNYFTPGISITFPKNGILNAGYSIGNGSWENTDNRRLFVYYGMTF
jgi:hypothetical protein